MNLITIILIWCYYQTTTSSSDPAIVTLLENTSISIAQKQNIFDLYLRYEYRQKRTPPDVHQKIFRIFMTQLLQNEPIDDSIIEKAINYLKNEFAQKPTQQNIINPYLESIQLLFNACHQQNHLRRFNRFADFIQFRYNYHFNINRAALKQRQM
eukprot:164665_1